MSSSVSNESQWVLPSQIRIPASNPKFRHYVILDTSRVVPVRRAKAFI